MASLREYVYISTRKIDAFGTGRRPRRWSVKKVNLKAGPLGGEVSGADSSTRKSPQAVEEVERSIHKAFDVKTSLDQGLKAGHWFRCDGLAMAYGIPRGFGDSGHDAAVFLGDDSKYRVFLCGSAEHLLDQRAPEARPSMSVPEAIGKLLAAASPSTPAISDLDPWVSVGYPYSNLQSELLRHMDPQPMSFLARCTRIVPDRYDEGVYVLGTPLFVALAAPE